MTFEATAFTGQQLKNLRLSLRDPEDPRVRYERATVYLLPEDAVAFLERIDEARRTFEANGKFAFSLVTESRRRVGFVDPVRRVFSIAAPDGVRLSFATTRSGREMLSTEALTASALLGSLIRHAKAPAFRHVFRQLAEEDPEAAAEVLRDHEEQPYCFALGDEPPPLEPSDLTKLLAAGGEVHETAMKASRKLRRAG